MSDYTSLKKLKRRHNCEFAQWGVGTGWLICDACEGRIHLPGCKSRKRLDPEKDCCEKRHIMLHTNGYTQGIRDSSKPMLGSHEHFGAEV